MVMQCDAQKTEGPQKMLARNRQSNVWPFKSWVFYRVYLAPNSSFKELMSELQECFKDYSVL
jgi:hypothetical protein